MSHVPHRITASTTVAAVIGSPVRHSLSPVLQAAAYAQLGLDWTMVAFEVEAGDGAAAVAAMGALGLGGMAVTMPLKAEVAAAVDDLDPAAAALRSVNTVVRLPDGRTRGLSTDGDGFVDSLLSVGVDPAGMSVLVIGAGGAGRSIIDALGRRGAGEIAVVNRTDAAAVEAAELSPVAGAAPVGDIVDIAGRADLIVNTTSLLVMISYLESTDAIAPVSHEVAQLLAPEGANRSLVALDPRTPIVISPYHLISYRNRAMSPLAEKLMELVAEGLSWDAG